MAALPRLLLQTPRAFSPSAPPPAPPRPPPTTIATSHAHDGGEVDDHDGEDHRHRLWNHCTRRHLGLLRLL